MSNQPLLKNTVTMVFIMFLLLSFHLLFLLLLFTCFYSEREINSLVTLMMSVFIFFVPLTKIWNILLYKDEWVWEEFRSTSRLQTVVTLC